MGVSVTSIIDGAREAVLLSSSGPSTGEAEPVSEPTVETGALLAPVDATGVSLESTAVPRVSWGARGEKGGSLFPSESGSAP